MSRSLVSHLDKTDTVKNLLHGIATKLNDWMEIFEKCISDKGLLFSIYKEFLAFNEN